jgi:membrane dipeptidase
VIKRLALPLGLVAALLVWTAALATAHRSLQQPPRPASAIPVVGSHARDLARDAIVIDTHADTTQWMLDGGYDFTNPTNTQMVSLAKAKQGGLKAQFFSIWTEPSYKGHYIERTLDLIDAIHRQVELHPDKVGLATTADQVRHLKSQGKFAMLMGIEGGHAIDDDLAVLRDYGRLGVRYMTLTWSNTNDWADSSGDINNPAVQHHNGITEFGRQVVAEMNRQGIIVDISHVSDKTFWDAIATSRAPVIASHSSARALVNAPRDMTDDMLRAVARNGGVVGVNFYSAFLSQKFLDDQKLLASQSDMFVNPVIAHWRNDWIHGYPHEDEAEREFSTAHLERPPFSVLIDHIVHIATVAGIDHVGLGSDWDGIDSAPQGMDSCADVPRIVQGLLDRGYNDGQIRKILGENDLRVMTAVEQVARELQKHPDSPERLNSGPVEHQRP